MKVVLDQGKTAIVFDGADMRRVPSRKVAVKQGGEPLQWCIYADTEKDVAEVYVVEGKRRVKSPTFGHHLTALVHGNIEIEVSE